jgi:hypothetical protein
MNIYEKLEQLQQEFKAPKSEFNAHGGFKYRSLEKMLEPLKPMLTKHKVALIFTDTLESCADVPHIVAHAKLINLEDISESVEVTASAQEAAIQKGMQAAQISGSTSSYARKYALSALLLVDETEELDSKQGDQTDFQAEITRAQDIKTLVELFNRMSPEEKKVFADALSDKKQELINAEHND